MSLLASVQLVIPQSISLKSCSQHVSLLAARYHASADRRPILLLVAEGLVEQCSFQLVLSLDTANTLHNPYVSC